MSQWQDKEQARACREQRDLRAAQQAELATRIVRAARHNDDMGIADLARRFDCDKGVVRRVLVAAGVQR